MNLSSPSSEFGDLGYDQLLKRYRHVRDFSLEITAPLSPEDCAMQTMEDTSPTRWHLAHTTWFFETFVLKQRSGFEPFDPSFETLFNSYYNSVGTPFPRSRRGQISRPGFEQTLCYREHVDRTIMGLLHRETLDDQQISVIELGLNHEQQHQELMLTDIKHVLSCNPIMPVYREGLPSDCQETSRNFHAGEPPPIVWENVSEGIVEVGHDGTGFAYDNEGPRHRAMLHSHQIASRCVTNGEYLEFMQSGGYRCPEHWLSMGWDFVTTEQIDAPLYWVDQDGRWQQFTLSGLKPICWDAPVCHVSFFEADAFARWSGKRLPTEFEWEHAASLRSQGEIFADRLIASGQTVHPCSAASHHFLGNLWEWTSSPYLAYPGYRPAAGALGEYNGKFMCNQFVLRGGSCATPSDHIRVSYRNFFPPSTRWQFSGIRLAR